MAERPLIDIAKLVAVQEAQLTSLERLGLGGLVEALKAYGIEDPELTQTIVKSMAATAFKGLARGVHPDALQAAGIDFEAAEQNANFKILAEALQKINQDPEAAVRELLLARRPDSGTKAAIDKLDVALEMQRHVGELRRSLAENLYLTPYNILFGLEANEELHLDLHPFTYAMLGDFHAPGVMLPVADLVVKDNSVELADMRIELPDVNPRAKAKIAEYQKVIAANPSFFKKLRPLMERTLIDSRIIAAAHPKAYSQGNTDETDAVRFNDPAELTRGESIFDPMSTVYNDPAKYAPIDEMSARIPRPGDEFSRYDLYIAKRTGDKLLVGILGAYYTGTNKKVASISLG